ALRGVGRSDRDPEARTIELRRRRRLALIRISAVWRQRGQEGAIPVWRDVGDAGEQADRQSSSAELKAVVELVIAPAGEAEAADAGPGLARVQQPAVRRPGRLAELARAGRLRQPIEEVGVPRQ